jgi:hypothetical protein
MNRRFIAGAALAAALIVPRYVRGHEGHVYKVMGTVATRHENHLQVKSTEGKSADITVNDKTKILRGNTRVKLGDISPGERIVVMATEIKGKDGKKTVLATEIKLGTAPAAATRK